MGIGVDNDAKASLPIASALKSRLWRDGISHDSNRVTLFGSVVLPALRDVASGQRIRRENLGGGFQKGEWMD